jgi:hypothetical protein
MTFTKRILFAVLAVSMLSTQQTFTIPEIGTPPINLSGNQDSINPFLFIGIAATFLITAVTLSSFCSKESTLETPATPTELSRNIVSFLKKVESKLGPELQEIKIVATEDQNHNEARKNLQQLIKIHFSSFFECSKHIHVVKNICTSFIGKSKACLKAINEEADAHDFIILKQEKKQLKKLKKSLKTFEKTIRWNYWGEHMGKEILNMMMREFHKALYMMTQVRIYPDYCHSDYLCSPEYDHWLEQYPYISSQFYDSCSELYNYYH